MSTNPNPADWTGDAARRASEGEAPLRQRLAVLVARARDAGLPPDAALAFAAESAAMLPSIPEGAAASARLLAASRLPPGPPADLLALTLLCAAVSREGVQESLRTLAYLADQATPDCEPATALCWQAAPGIDGFAAHAEAMVRAHLRSLVHAARHQANVAIRTARGHYGNVQRAFQASTATERLAAGRVSQMRICGHVLGQMTGSLIRETIDGLGGVIRTHKLHRALLRSISPMVADDAVAGSVLAEEQFESAFAAAQMEVGNSEPEGGAA